jgi:hypothetical protein
MRISGLPPCGAVFTDTIFHRFLLKYATRADVDLLKQGTGGFAEAREAIAQYSEASPLFGLVIYRRKRVLLKYVPEDTSRLLQGQHNPFTMNWSNVTDLWLFV